MRWRAASSPRLTRTLRTEATVLHRPSMEIPRINFELVQPES